MGKGGKQECEVFHREHFVCYMREILSIRL